MLPIITNNTTNFLPGNYGGGSEGGILVAKSKVKRETSFIT